MNFYFYSFKHCTSSVFLFELSCPAGILNIELDGDLILELSCNVAVTVESHLLCGSVGRREKVGHLLPALCLHGWLLLTATYLQILRSSQCLWVQLLITNNINVTINFTPSTSYQLLAFLNYNLQVWKCSLLANVVQGHN